MWARSTDTVVGNAGGVLAMGLRASANFELRSGPYLEPGPLPDYNHCGYEVAMQMVNDSRKKGRTSDDNKQFNSTRKLRTTFSNQVRASAATNTEPIALEENEGKSTRGLPWTHVHLSGLLALLLAARNVWVKTRDQTARSVLLFCTIY
jgi:hypothetical protein